MIGEFTAAAARAAELGQTRDEGAGIKRRTFLAGLVAVLIASPTVPAMGATPVYYGRGYAGGYR